MKKSEGRAGESAKKAYRKPTVESRALKLGVYGDYGGNGGPTGGGHDGGGHNGGHHGGHHGGRRGGRGHF